ncbi:MAG: primosomal protein N' [Muribaculaceae bacterium]|nr:primosomal protein N' [Muribaculaceae bacterium]
MIYARVIVPRPLDEAFTYTVPEHLQNRIGVGYRVVVPFGNKRFVTGIVESLSPVRPSDVATFKDVTDVVDTEPTVVHPQLKFWRWIADYYMCAVGDVMKAALPAGLKLESETVVSAVTDPEPGEVERLSRSDYEVYSKIAASEKIAVSELSKTFKGAEAAVTRLVDADLVEVHESMVNRYRRVKVQTVRPTLGETSAEAVSAAFAAVKRSAAQTRALTALIALSGFNNPTVATRAVSRSDLLESDPEITWPAVQALAKKGLAAITVREMSRFAPPEDGSGAFNLPLPKLSDAQADALDRIHKSLMVKPITLLRGVTSSGKTEIYIHLIRHVLDQGRQALFLVPEIALTTQLTRRLQKVFGAAVVIYHSKFSDNERVDIWRDMLHNRRPCVVIGARSSVFLPFANLGLVIVDEEHEPSYKQFDPAPRYNARDAAMVLAQMHGAKTVLGSATPTAETYYKATEGGKYGLVELLTRYGDGALPVVETIDLNREREKGAVVGSLSDSLIAMGRRQLRDNRQLIFFHNRRGFAPRARCRQCQFVPKCDRCDVALTFHKGTNTLECHYCGAVYPVPSVCPNCHEPAMRIEGFGTERIEETIEGIYPEAKVLRMDLDTTRNKTSYANIIDDFSAHKADILIGTQMVTKGLDFGDVGMVGVINADNVINYPDFRSAERAFNMLEQVAGRAGRRADLPGRVVVQTYNPDHPVLRFVKGHDYVGFYEYEIAQRRAHYYPPFARIINIYIKHKEESVVEAEARRYADQLRTLLGNRVNGPIVPPVGRVASQYIRRIMLRVENGVSISEVKNLLRRSFIEFNKGLTRTTLTVYYDVDPA